MARDIQLWLTRIFTDRRKRGRTDLEAIEMGLRTTLHQVGALALQQLLQYPEPVDEQRRRPCRCGHTARYLELRSKRVITVLGPVKVHRPYFLCPLCGEGQCPVDDELDVKQTTKSPGVRRMLAVVGQEAPFDRGRQQMESLAGLVLTTKEVERTAEAIGADIAAREKEQIQQVMRGIRPKLAGPARALYYVQIDGTGVPVVNAETVGRTGRIEGRPPRTREAKLGCVFTQTTCDENGYALRDAESTTYVGAIETAEEFGKRIYREACHRGGSCPEKMVVMGDGAEWIWNIAEEHFHGALQIVDLYHARQHLWALVRQLYPNQDLQQKRWILRHQHQLDHGRIDLLVGALRSLQPASSDLAQKIQTEAEYFLKNAKRMRYPEFRRQHLFVGSGVIEAGCKSVIGSRLKQSGMFWTVRGANSILALRTCLINGRFEDYWSARVA